MSTDKSHAAHEFDPDADLPIGDLSDRPVDEKSADQARGGDGTRVVLSDIPFVKSVDKPSAKLY